MENLDKIDDILYDGTKEEIEALKCDCGGDIHFSFGRRFVCWCNNCGTIVSNSIEEGLIPNCVKYFGNER